MWPRASIPAPASAATAASSWRCASAYACSSPVRRSSRDPSAGATTTACKGRASGGIADDALPGRFPSCTRRRQSRGPCGRHQPIRRPGRARLARRRRRRPVRRSVVGQTAPARSASLHASQTRTASATTPSRIHAQEPEPDGEKEARRRRRQRQRSGRRRTHLYLALSHQSEPPGSGTTGRAYSTAMRSHPACRLTSAATPVPARRPRGQAVRSDHDDLRGSGRARLLDDRARRLACGPRVVQRSRRRPRPAGAPPRAPARARGLDEGDHAGRAVVQGPEALRALRIERHLRDGQDDRPPDARASSIARSSARFAASPARSRPRSTPGETMCSAPSPSPVGVGGAGSGDTPNRGHPGNHASRASTCCRKRDRPRLSQPAAGRRAWARRLRGHRHGEPERERARRRHLARGSPRPKRSRSRAAASRPCNVRGGATASTRCRRRWPRDPVARIGQAEAQGQRRGPTGRRHVRLHPPGRKRHPGAGIHRRTPGRTTAPGRLLRAQDNR